MARLSGSVSDTWLSPFFSSAERCAAYSLRFFLSASIFSVRFSTREPPAASMNFCKDPVVKLRSLLLTALMRVPSTASNSRPNRSRRRHRITNSRKTFLNAARLSLRKSAIVLKSAQQPDDLDVAMTFGLKTAARPNPVEIAVDIELQEIAGRVAGTARRLRLDPLETGGLQIKPIDEGIDEADGVVDADVIVNRLGQKQELRTIEPGNVRHAKL